MIAKKQLNTVMPLARGFTEIYLDPLNAACAQHEINTPARIAAFLAQLAHESGQLRYVREIATGEAYEGRADLGNTQPGDGIRYKGRGLIQITGRANYEKCGAALGINLIDRPETLETPEYACKSAAWYWQAHGCNELADSGDFSKITKKINGGQNGRQDRESYYARAKSTFNIA